jgi:hypothetical protein
MTADGGQPEYGVRLDDDAPFDVAIIAVHGVGDPEPGSLLGNLEEAITRYWEVDLKQLGPQPGFERLVDVLDGRRLELRRTMVNSKRVVLVDANWADIGRAPKQWWAQIPYSLKLLVGTVVLAADGGARAPVLIFGLIFSWAFRLFLPAIAALPLISLAGILPNSWIFGLAAAVVAAALVAIAWYLREFDGPATAGNAIAAAVVVALAVAHLCGVPLMPVGPRDLGLPDWTFAAVAAAGPALILLALVEGLVRSLLCRKMPPITAVSRIGLLILSFALASTLMVIAFLLGLYGIGWLIQQGQAREAALDAWGNAYACTLPYNIAPAEAVVAASILLAAVPLLVALAMWWCMVRRGVPTAGVCLRRRLGAVFVWIIVLFLLLSGFLAVDMAGVLGWIDPTPLVGWFFDPQSLRYPAAGVGEKCDVNLFDIYRRSLIPRIPALVAVAAYTRIGLDVATDVLIYLRSGEAVCDRLRQTLRRFQPRSRRLAVVAHSQGSRVAMDAILGGDGQSFPGGGRLATTGSPISALIGGFLHRADIPPKRSGWQWCNFYRGTDPIGGVIDGERDWPRNHQIDENLEKNHINYWIERDVIRFLLE